MQPLTCWTRAMQTAPESAPRSLVAKISTVSEHQCSPHMLCDSSREKSASLLTLCIHTTELSRGLKEELDFIKRTFRTPSWDLLPSNSTAFSALNNEQWCDDSITSRWTVGKISLLLFGRKKQSFQEWPTQKLFAFKPQGRITYDPLKCCRPGKKECMPLLRPVLLLRATCSPPSAAAALLHSSACVPHFPPSLFI